ncbi:NAD(P)-dependent oxidoreductase [Heyndrickxia acidicola]|uniref:NAD(P)-dependent oxidoreductase n=1 Tax=Heyndrickxia acidicola TaxID=209389 RepID=A0ABU6MRD9_9BACI|nr:NAD(P)-dependent oxidoreductase [Heyndrickxia acidicola]MED1205787.1 NAD(P)-dependent oxidoreductase [Heyndrickxia acidicola]
MKIGIIGSSGKAGSQLLKEAAERGHAVTAIVRNASKIQNKSIEALEKNIFDLKAKDLQPFDVVINAFNAAPGQEVQHVEAGRVLIEALKEVEKTRLIVVGGAGSLFADETKSVRVFDTPDFPEAYLQTAKNMGQNLYDLQAANDLQWTYISPAAFFDPAGKRTGSYQKGHDILLKNSNGESYISYADYAIAVLDEIEHPQHINQRFTVVGEKE